MGEMMRTFDWSKHPLGPSENWPQSLITVIRLMLHSGFPMFVWWSKELYMFHNDAYLPAMGTKPKAPGAKARQVWYDVMDQLGAIIDAVLNGQEQFYFQDLLVPMERKGFAEETYWTFSYSPMPNDEGGVGGLFCSCVEVTDSVLSKRRLKMMKELSEAMVLCATIEESSQKACSVLTHSADVPFSIIYLLNTAGTQALLAGKTDGLPASWVPIHIGLSPATGTDEDPWVMSKVKETGQAEMIALSKWEGLVWPGSPDSGAALAGFPNKAVVLPIFESGDNQLLGFFLAGISAHLEYDETYQGFHQMLAGQIATALSTVRSRQQAEQERSRLKNLFMEAPSPIVILEGPEMVYQLVNPVYQQIFSGRQLLGKPLLEALPELAETPIFSILQEVYQSGKTFEAQELPVMLARREGGPLEQFYWNFTYQARFNAQAEIDGVLVFANDVTGHVLARRGLEESAQRFQLLTESIPQIIWTATPDGNLDYFSGQWWPYSGLNYQESKGQGWASAIHSDDMPHLSETWTQCLQTGEPYQVEARVKRFDGIYRWFLIRALPLRDEHSKITQWVGTCTDLQDQKSVAEHLQVLSNELAAINTELASANEEIISSNEELMAKNEELSIVNQRLAKVNADLDNFVYAASHDLKSPITSLSALLGFLNRRLDGKLDDKGKELLKMIENSSERLQRTIRDLTQVAKVQRSTEEEKGQVAFPELWKDIQADLQPLIQESKAQIKVDFEEPSFFYARKNARSILYNLVSNALKYRSPDRLAEVTIATRRSNGRVILTVEDNGLGLTTMQQQNLFTMFKRFHNHVEGSGVGLYMIKRMIENNGGGIQVDSQVGQGTRFTVHF